MFARIRAALLDDEAVAHLRAQREIAPEADGVVLGAAFVDFASTALAGSSGAIGLIIGLSPFQMRSPLPRRTIARTNASYSAPIRAMSSAKYSRNTAGPTCRPMARRRSLRVPARLESHSVLAMRPSTASTSKRSSPAR